MLKETENDKNNVWEMKSDLIKVLASLLGSKCIDTSVVERNCLKTVAFIAGKKNPAIQKIFICFSIENFIENISLYALSWPELNFGCYPTLEIIF